MGTSNSSLRSERAVLRSDSRSVPLRTSPRNPLPHLADFIIHGWNLIMRWKIALLMLLIVPMIAVAPRIRLRAVHTTSATVSPKLVFGEPFTLQETQAALIVKPKVSVDPIGGFLVADVRERQIRRYDASGQLERVIAGGGDGPGEFRHPAAALRLPSQRIVAVDMHGRVAVFDPSGTRLLETQNVPLLPIYSAAVLNDSTLVFAGKKEPGDQTQLVHIWNLNRQSIIRSFAEMPIHPTRMDAAYAFAGSASVAVRQQEVAVSFALSDSIRVFNEHGDLQRSIEIPTTHYRRLIEPMPESENPEDLDRWLSTFSATASLYWRTDGALVVQYLDVNKADEYWNVVGVGLDGTRLFEFTRQPRLLTAYPDGKLLFVNPASELQNSWVPAFVE